MLPLEMVVSDFWLGARETLFPKRILPHLMQSVAFTNTEKKPGESGTACEHYTSSDYTHTRRAMAEKVGHNSYVVYEHHMFTDLLSGSTRTQPLSFFDVSILRSATYTRDKAAELITRWEMEQRGVNRLNKQVKDHELPTPESTPYHPSHFEKQRHKPLRSVWLSIPQ